MSRRQPNRYEHGFECMKCSHGCYECVDDSPCMYSVQVALRLTLLAINGICMVMALGFAVFVFLNWKKKVNKFVSFSFEARMEPPETELKKKKITVKWRIFLEDFLIFQLL